MALFARDHIQSSVGIVNPLVVYPAIQAAECAVFVHDIEAGNWQCMSGLGAVCAV